MKKRKPSHELTAFKAVIARAMRSSKGRPVIALSALQGARSIGYGVADMGRAVASLERKHFSHSVTSHQDSREWQDVYHLPVGDLTIYVKFRADVVTEFRLLSFKDRDED